MSNTWKKRKKWFDDEWDVNDNSQKINKERRLRRDRKEADAHNEDETDVMFESRSEAWKWKQPNRY